LKKHPRVFCATRRVIAKVDETRSLSFVFSVFFVANCFFQDNPEHPYNLRTGRQDESVARDL